MDTLVSIDLPTQDYWVISDAALVLHGVRYDTSNLELGCNEKLFDTLIEQGFKATEGLLNRPVIDYKEDIRIYKDWTSEQIEYIENLPVATLSSIRQQKKLIGRKEDQHDIELINKLINILDTL